MDRRIRRLARELEETHGWTVYEDRRECTCGKVSYGRDEKYCPNCGKSLPPFTLSEAALYQLEDALKDSGFLENNNV